jgi:hypothetical protein
MRCACGFEHSRLVSAVGAADFRNSGRRTAFLLVPCLEVSVNHRVTSLHSDSPSPSGPRPGHAFPAGTAFQLLTCHFPLHLLIFFVKKVQSMNPTHRKESRAGHPGS